MNPAADSTTRTMLALSAITYRGFNLIGPQAAKRAHLRALLDECIANVSAIKNQWEVVWGPCDFSSGTVGLDDSMMFVARSRAEPGTLAIAIRGTNPIAIRDWIFGDAMVAHPRPWAGGDRGACISASTDLGLAVLRHLRWDPSVLKSGASVNWIERLEHRLRLLDLKALGRTAEERTKALAGGSPDQPMGRGLGVEEQPAGGTSLEDFVRAHLQVHPSARINVTGHSKGGALSSTLALWLKQIFASSSIAAYSFAGPTAGNGAFARYSDRILGADCHRIWNLRDVVPRAFVPALMKEVPEILELSGVEGLGVQALIAAVVTAVQQLDYTQICGAGSSFDLGLASGLSLPLQMAHQHLDSYLAWAGLLDEMDTARLFAPAL